jgi:hypothetical protein
MTASSAADPEPAADHHAVVAAHADGLVDAFVARGRRDRLRATRSTAKGRATFARALALEQPFDPGAAHPVAAADATPERLLALLVARGAPATCVLFTADGTEQVVPLAAALAEVVGQAAGAVVSCLPGALAYAEDESGTRVVLR